MRRRLITLVASLAITATVAFAANDRVTGVVIKINIESNSITLRTAPNTFRTLSLTSMTSYKRGAKAIRVEDINIGDQVVIEVPPKTAQAVTIQVVPSTPSAKP